MKLESGDEHGWRRPPTPAGALADALGRSGAELSATEVLRSELERSEDLAALVPALVEARRLVNRGAGPNRYHELLERQDEFLRVDDMRSIAAQRLHMAEEHVKKAQAAVEASGAEFDALGDRGGLFRRRQHSAAAEQAERTLEARLGRLGGLEAEAEQARCALQGVDRGAAEAQGRFRELVAAEAVRDAWMADHPVEVAWMEDLAERVAERRSDWPGPPRSTHQPTCCASSARRRSSEAPASNGWATQKRWRATGNSGGWSPTGSGSRGTCGVPRPLLGRTCNFAWRPSSRRRRAGCSGHTQHRTKG